MKPVRITSPGAPGWLALRMALWPAGQDEHLADMEAFVRDPRQAAFVLYDEAGAGIGLVETSLRHDYVNGAESSPVGYLEGIYVAPPCRRRGVARRLVEHAMQWAARQGCTEFASDVAVDNADSRAMHRALGFQETDSVVYFVKPIGAAPVAHTAAGGLEIRAAQPADVALLADLIRELAVVERFPHPVTVTPDDLLANLFGPQPAAQALIAEADGEVAGFAVYYATFSTTTGRPGLHLDDLFIRPAFQGRGYGKALLAHVAGIAQQRGCARFEWWTLKSNQPALRFYEAVGARRVEELAVHRVQGGAIEELAGRGRPIPRGEAS